VAITNLRYVVVDGQGTATRPWSGDGNQTTQGSTNEPGLSV